MDLYSVLRTATFNISDCYFKLPIDGGKPVYRERVYCYELYHQMRCCWPNTQFVLNGEVDKSGHPSPLGRGKHKPDLLVHGPGDMEKNFAVIEVKPSNVETKGIRKDLTTLSFFVDSGKYQNAIFLIYGDRAKFIAKRVRSIANEFPLQNKLQLWIHEKPHSSAEICD